MHPLPPADVARRWFEVMWNERKSELGQIVEGWDFWNLGGLMQTMSAP